MKKAANITNLIGMILSIICFCGLVATAIVCFAGMQFVKDYVVQYLKQYPEIKVTAEIIDAAVIATGVCCVILSLFSLAATVISIIRVSKTTKALDIALIIFAVLGSSPVLIASAILTLIDGSRTPAAPTAPAEKPAE